MKRLNASLFALASLTAVAVLLSGCGRESDYRRLLKEAGEPDGQIESAIEKYRQMDTAAQEAAIKSLEALKDKTRRR